MPHRENILEVKARAKSIFAKTYHYPEVPFRSIGRRCFKWAMDMARFEAEHGTKGERAEREAQQIAAAHGFNIETLTFEVERRKFGSFTTTGEGSPERQAIYRRALDIARTKQSHHLEAAE
jgi:hypothetical protein